MPRSCITPGCVVLLASTGPMCSRCYAKVPEVVKTALQSARIAEAKADGAEKRKAEIEYQAALDMAVTYAAGRVGR